MDNAIIEQLTRLTDEERSILGGDPLRRDAYSATERFIISGARLLDGQALALRPHTRFVDFPEHGHDYMEFMYVYAGRISHVIGRETVTLEKGDILFLNRHARHAVRRAGQQDIGINFILSDTFLQALFGNVQNNPVMSAFLTNNLDSDGEGEYLFFRTKDCFPIRNLMDNLIYAVVHRSQEVYAGLVSLLFTYLAYYRDTLVNTLRDNSPDAALRRAVLAYLEAHYPDATLLALARELGYAPAYLSRRIHKLFSKPFRLLLQETRLKVAERLLRTTALGTEHILRAVGYENRSHFYRAFFRTYHTTPHKYRKQFHERPAAP